MSWMREIEATQNVHDLRSPFSIRWNITPTSRCWTPWSQSLWRRSWHSRIPTEKSTEKNKTPEKDERLRRERRIAHMIDEDYRISGSSELMLDFSSLGGDDVQELDPKWNEVLFSTSEAPKDDILVSVVETNLRGSELLKTIFAPNNTRYRTTEWSNKIYSLTECGQKVIGSSNEISSGQEQMRRRKTRECRPWVAKQVL